MLEQNNLNFSESTGRPRDTLPYVGAKSQEAKKKRKLTKPLHPVARLSDRRSDCKHHLPSRGMIMTGMLLDIKCGC